MAVKSDRPSSLVPLDTDPCFYKSREFLLCNHINAKNLSTSEYYPYLHVAVAQANVGQTHGPNGKNSCLG